MLTSQDIGNEAVYSAALREIKEKLPFSKKLLKNKFSREEAQEVRRLCISKAEVTDFEFLRFFPNLEDFRMEYVSGTKDILGLRFCPNLRELEFTNCEMPELENVAFCKELTYFAYYLEDEYKKHGKSDFDFLQELSELKVICVTGNKLRDVSALANLQKVEHLVLEDNPIETIAPLKTMQSLKQLELEYCNLSRLEDLEAFGALKTIYAEGNPFSEEQKAEYHEKYPHIEIDFDN